MKLEIVGVKRGFSAWEMLHFKDICRREKKLYRNIHGKYIQFLAVMENSPLLKISQL